MIFVALLFAKRKGRSHSDLCMGAEMCEKFGKHWQKQYVYIIVFAKSENTKYNEFFQKKYFARKEGFLIHVLI